MCLFVKRCCCNYQIAFELCLVVKNQLGLTNQEYLDQNCNLKTFYLLLCSKIIVCLLQSVKYELIPHFFNLFNIQHDPLLLFRLKSPSCGEGLVQNQNEEKNNSYCDRGFYMY